MGKMLKRFVCFFIAVLMAVSVLSGCTEKSNNGQDSAGTTAATTTTAASEAATEPAKGIKIDPAKDVTLKFFTMTAVNKTELDATLEEFNKKYPNIKVDTVVIPGAEYATKVKTSIVAGEQLDIIEVSTGNIDRAQASSMYLPLDELVDKAGLDIKKEYGEYADQLVVDGILYGIPKYLAPAGIWYNKRHFDEAQIPYPTPDWTWDEFFEIAKKLTKKDANGKVTRYGFYDWNFLAGGTAGAVLNYALYGGWQVLNDDGTPNIDSPIFRKAVTDFYNASMVDKSMPDLATVIAEKYHYMYDMYKGKWSMLISARNTAVFFDVHRINGQLPAEDDEAEIYQLAYIPRWDTSSPRKLSADSVTGDAIAKGTKYPDEAFVFVLWHTTESLVLSAKVSHRVPASRTLDVNTLLDSWTYYQDKDGNIVQGKKRDELFKTMLDPEIKPIFPVNQYKYGYSKKMTDEIDKELSLLFAGEKDIDRVIADLKAALAEIYEKEGKK